MICSFLSSQSASASSHLHLQAFRVAAMRSLRELVSQQSQRATKSGSLRPLLNDVSLYRDGPFTYMLCQKRASITYTKPTPSDVAAARRDPFLPPYDADLHVAWGSPDVFTQSPNATPHAPYTLVLNKFCVVPDHLLLVSTDWVDQRSLLTSADFSAWWTALHGMESIGFYNGGTGAGGSQPHRHMQIIPTPISSLLEELPFERFILDAGRDAAGLFHVPALKFPHCCSLIEEDSAGEHLSALYRSLLKKFGLLLETDGADRLLLPPYNLLLTRHYMMVVPRARETVRGDTPGKKISCNGFNFFGSFFIKSDEARMFLLEKGAMYVLNAVTALGKDSDAPTTSK